MVAIEVEDFLSHETEEESSTNEEEDEECSTFDHQRMKKKMNRMLELVIVKLNPLWELAPRCYQLSQMSMVKLVENWVDCWMEAQMKEKIVLVYCGEKNP